MNTLYYQFITCYKLKKLFSHPEQGLDVARADYLNIKGRVHCYSMQVVTNKCFLLNSKTKLAQTRLFIFEKNAKSAPLIPKNDVTEPKARLL